MATKKKVALPDWDADSPQLQANLRRVDASVRADSIARVIPTFEGAREWHATMMNGLDAGDPILIGNFRGEPGLETEGVEVLGIDGTMPWLVEAELQDFEIEIQARVAELDAAYPDADSLDDVGINRVIALAARAHSEWVRIHPFANGNGRTSRIWSNLILQRYGLPPVLRLRPRPDESAYGQAGRAGMLGDDRPLRAFIRRKYDDAVQAAGAAAKKSRPKKTPKK